jgi:hypothetical protein
MVELAHEHRQYLGRLVASMVFGGPVGLGRLNRRPTTHFLPQFTTFYHHETILTQSLPFVKQKMRFFEKIFRILLRE